MSGDPVNHPAHYTSGGIECIDAIEAALTPEEFRGFCKGNALKYVWRAGKKDDAHTDIRKAAWYLDRLPAPWCNDTVCPREHRIDEPCVQCHSCPICLKADPRLYTEGCIGCDPNARPAPTT